MSKKRTFLLFFVLVFICLSASSQTLPLSIKSIIASADTLRNRIPAEKLYLQFDKPYYSTGDTIWFKAYLFDAAFLTGSKKSGLVYIELANDTNKVLMQRMMPLAFGIGWGNIVLNPDDIPEGSYTIRAYTNLMRNFGEDLVFKKSFYVSGNTSQNWLVNSNVSLSKHSGRDSLNLALRFNTLNKEVVGLREMDIKVLEGKRKVLFRDKAETHGDGTLDLNFTLPEKTDAKRIALVAEDLRKGQEHKVIIPIPVNRPENMDLQFMPEGGNMVDGVAARIGFKAIGEDGLGTATEGKIYSSSGEFVAGFKSGYKGMGFFNLIPKAGENYTAKIALPDGTQKSYPLPEVKPLGSTLSISNKNENDSLEVSVMISPDLLKPAGSFFLVAQARGIVCYGAIIRGNTQRMLSKNLFPSGITKFTLLNAERQLAESVRPVNERIIYIDHHDNLNISLIPSKASYAKRDSIALTIEVKDHEGNPIQGSFSVAVTDNSQVKTDSLGNNILTSLLLTSDLKGNAEDPGHYFQNTEQAALDLDNLLLTQGWKGYSWKDIFKPLVPEFEAEPEFTVKGRVSNALSGNLKQLPVMILSSRPAFLKDTITDQKGLFSFSGFPVQDTLKFLIQARNKNDKSFNVGIDVDQFKPPVFKPDDHQFMPWYVNSDTTLLKYINTAVTQRQDQYKITNGGNILSEVIIKTKKFVKDSKNLNGAGEADIVMDEKDMDKAKKITLLDILEKRLPGFKKNNAFGKSVIPRFNLLKECPWIGNSAVEYVVSRRAVKLVIDGVFTGTYRAGEDEMFMNYLTAEDIKGIEIMSTTKNMDKYFSIEPKPSCAVPQTFNTDPAIYVEITTWSGHGYEMKKTPGTYFYRAIPFVGIEEFYRPKYTIKNPLTLIDLRSIIHWEPNVITDKNGKGFVSLYAADRPGTYTIITEGSDMNGNIGRKTGIINIK